VVVIGEEWINAQSFRIRSNTAIDIQIGQWQLLAGSGDKTLLEVYFRYLAQSSR
jgi:hypothetical protein